jgi:hypothetical protein
MNGELRLEVHVKYVLGPIWLIWNKININENFYYRTRAVIALGYGLDDRGSIPGGGWEFFSSPPRPERLWGPPSLLSNGY